MRGLSDSSMTSASGCEGVVLLGREEEEELVVLEGSVVLRLSCGIDVLLEEELFVSEEEMETGAFERFCSGTADVRRYVKRRNCWNSSWVKKFSGMPMSARYVRPSSEFSD